MKDLNLRIDNNILRYINETDLLTSNLLKSFKSRFNNLTLRFQYQEQKLFNDYKKNNTYPLISLDPLIKGDYNIGISRLYVDQGRTFSAYTHRPECDPVFIQLSKLPKNQKVILFDDDIGFGGQIKFLKKLLLPRGLLTLPFTFLENKDPNLEVLDIRDFIYKAELGGLVVEENQELKRVPYLYPFVDTKARASIVDQIQFSLELWEFNKKYHEEFTNRWDYQQDCETYIELCKQKLKESSNVA